jgi:hypothetical protein
LFPNIETSLVWVSVVLSVGFSRSSAPHQALSHFEATRRISNSACGRRDRSPMAHPMDRFLRSAPREHALVAVGQRPRDSSSRAASRPTTRKPPSAIWLAKLRSVFGAQRPASTILLPYAAAARSAAESRASGVARALRIRRLVRGAEAPERWRHHRRRDRLGLLQAPCCSGRSSHRFGTRTSRAPQATARQGVSKSRARATAARRSLSGCQISLRSFRRR